jgi:threonine dehydratase
MRDLDPSRIRTGHGQIDPVFLDTPVIRWSADGAGRGTEIIFKDERASPIRSFKGRGADLLVRAFPPATDFVCASAGNFGQGMAWAARRRAGRVLVFAARTAARCKIEAMRELGAQVVLEGASFDEAKHAARAFAAGSDKIFVEDGVHPELAEGAGTIALELTDQFDALDAIFVPLGNGSLAAGIGCWFKRHSPRTRVVAVCAAGAPAMGLAVLGQAFHAAGCSTIADGIAVRVPDPSAVAAVRRVVDKVLFVDDGDIRRALALIE